MAIKPVTGEIQAQDINDNFSYLESQTNSIVGGPIDTFKSLAELNTKHPNGTLGYAVVLESDGVTGYMYTWTGTIWKKGALYQAQGLSDGSVNEKKIANEAVTRGKLKNDVVSELDTFIENNIATNFELINADFWGTNNTISLYNRYFGAVKKLVLKGFDLNYEHRIRFITRNQATMNYRFIICYRKTENDRWQDIFDTTAEFKVTENPLGLTPVSYSTGGRTVEMLVDYRTMGNGYSLNDGALAVGDGRYKINKNCFYQNTTDGLKEAIDKISVNNQTNDNVVVQKLDKKMKIKYRYNNEFNEQLVFGELGINKIIHLTEINREIASSLTSEMTIPSYYKMTTDWISPYQNVESLNNKTSDFTGTVGGNHGTSGSDGFPTAENVSYEFYLDGVEVKEGEVAMGKKATIIATNVMSASNRIDVVTGEKSKSLQEIVVYQITKNNIEVSVTLTALEDITIQHYIGLQMTTNMMAGEAYFGDTDTKILKDGVYRKSASLPFNNDTLVFGNAQHLYVTYTNRNVGLGTLDKLGSNPVFFKNTVNKLYAHLIGDPLTIRSGESFFYAGGYTLMAPLKCDGAEAAYIIKKNGKTIYCVDFLKSAVVAYLEFTKTDLGKEIEIVKKSDSITCDQIISGKGLKLSSTGLGKIQFTLK